MPSNCLATPQALPSTNLRAVKRLGVLVLVLLSVAVPAQAIAAVPSIPAQQAQDEPAVVIDDTEGAPEETAWTFRFLVPMLMVLTLVMVVGLVAWYQRGFRGRYRVRE